MPVIMKCFERLVLACIKACIPPTHDQHQFAYRANRSTDDAIATALHTALTHLENPKTYVRMLFVDFSSAFNCISPYKLVNKLQTLGIHPSLCFWILEFIRNRPQGVTGPSHLLHYHPQHWHSSRLCPQSNPLLPVHQRLHLHSQFQHCCEIHRWHNHC